MILENTFICPLWAEIYLVEEKEYSRNTEEKIQIEEKKKKVQYSVKTEDFNGSQNSWFSNRIIKVQISNSNFNVLKL